MKKIYFWSLGLLSVVVLGLWLYSQRWGQPVEGVLPSNPVAFVRLAHLHQHVDELIHSDLGKNIASIDLPDVLTRNHFSTRDIHDLRLWQKDLVKLWENPLVQKFLGKEASIALYSDGRSYQAFVVLRLTFSTRIVELFGQMFQNWGQGITLRHRDYQGWGINHILLKKQGFGLSYVRIRDLMIIAPDSLGHLRNVIDVYQQKKPSLADDPAYSFVRQNAYPSGDGLVFINFNRLSGIWQGQSASRIASLGHETGAFAAYGLSYMPGAVSKYKMIVGLDDKYFSPGMRKTFSCPALSNDTMKLVPVNALLYNWGICYDFDQSWTAIQQGLSDNPQLLEGIEKLKQRFEHHFQVNIRKDILPVFAHEIGGYLTDVDLQGNYPFPRFLIFVKVNDHLAAESLMEKLTRYPGIDVHTEDYEHVGIHYVSLPLGANTDPGYAFLDNYLLVASSRQLLKRSIDAYSDSFHSIASDDLINDFSLGAGQKFHSMTLMKTAELSRRAQDLLGWMDKYLSGQVSMAAAYKEDGNNKKKELDEAIADKSAELILAQRKLIQLRASSAAGLNLQDPDVVSGSIDNLSREAVTIKEDISNYLEQKEDLTKLISGYMAAAQSAKLTMYNMENVVSPLLKGLESINAQAVTVRFGDKLLETELLVK